MTIGSFLFFFFVLEFCLYSYILISFFDFLSWQGISDLAIVKGPGRSLRGSSI